MQFKTLPKRFGGGINKLKPSGPTDMLGKPMKQPRSDYSSFSFQTSIQMSSLNEDRWGLSAINSMPTGCFNYLPTGPTSLANMPVKSKPSAGTPAFLIYSQDAMYMQEGRNGKAAQAIKDQDAGDIGEIGIVYGTAKALLHIPGDFYTAAPWQWGQNSVQDGPHSLRFQMLQSAPSMARIKELLPYRQGHPHLEAFLTSLEDQPWLGRAPWEVMSDNRMVAEHANAWLDEYRRHASTEKMQRMVREWEASAEAQYQNLALPLERLLDRTTTPLEVIRINLGTQTDQADRDSLAMLQEGVTKLMQGCEQHQHPGKLRSLVCRLEYTKRKGFYYHCLALAEPTEASLATELRELWKQSMPEGHGAFWNCQDELSQYRKLGIGRLEPGDNAAKRRLVDDVLAQLTRIDKDCRLVLPESQFGELADAKQLHWWFGNAQA